jgi:hypothetical protein
LPVSDVDVSSSSNSSFHIGGDAIVMISDEGIVTRSNGSKRINTNVSRWWSLGFIIGNTSPEFVPVDLEATFLTRKRLVGSAIDSTIDLTREGGQDISERGQDGTNPLDAGQLDRGSGGEVPQDVVFKAISTLNGEVSNGPVITTAIHNDCGSSIDVGELQIGVCLQLLGRDFKDFEVFVVGSFEEGLTVVDGVASGWQGGQEGRGLDQFVEGSIEVDRGSLGWGTAVSRSDGRISGEGSTIDNRARANLTISIVQISTNNQSVGEIQDHVNGGTRGSSAISVPGVGCATNIVASGIKVSTNSDSSLGIGVFALEVLSDKEVEPGSNVSKGSFVSVISAFGDSRSRSWTPFSVRSTRQGLLRGKGSDGKY